MLDVDVEVRYTAGMWSGHLIRDQVTLVGVNNVSARTVIAGIEFEQQFFLNDSIWQGILGLSYPALTKVFTSALTCDDTLLINLLADRGHVMSFSVIS